MKNKDLLLKALHKAIEHADGKRTKNSIGFVKPTKAREDYELRRFGAKLRMMVYSDPIEKVALELGIKPEEVEMFLELPPVTLKDMIKKER